MTTREFLIVYLSCLVAILACRCIPILLLKGRQLPERVSDAIGLIPSAAFAALIANDLFKPGMFDAGIWPAAAPLVASVAVALVAKRTRSLLWCVIAGVSCYALILLI